MNEKVFMSNPVCTFDSGGGMHQRDYDRLMNNTTSTATFTPHWWSGGICDIRVETPHFTEARKTSCYSAAACEDALYLTKEELARKEYELKKASANNK